MEVGQTQYGYLGFESHVVSAVEDVTGFVETVSVELSNKRECYFFFRPPFFASTLLRGKTEQNAESKLKLQAQQLYFCSLIPHSIFRLIQFNG